MLIGRINEQKRLKKALLSDESEFVAVYGRRRVGKTYLIRETFGYQFTFSHIGLAKKNTREQLKNFQSSLRKQGLPKAVLPKNWFEAFDLLETLVKQSKDKKKVIFIDELPWMDSPKSGFVTAIEHFWNSFASARKDIVFIVCGSATSWIIKKILKNKGGLHNRITIRIHLNQFTLNECEQYAQTLRLGMTHRQLMECYMVMGGVPYYWSLLDSEKSLAQNIDYLFFSKYGELRNEFSELYASLFKNPEKYISIIEALGQKKVGMTREEIVKEGKIPYNGNVSVLLDELESCGFIRKYTTIGHKNKNAVFQLIDQYTLFYYKFIHNNPVNDPQFWSKSLDKPIYNNWCGLAFERLCLLHSRQIKEALGVAGVISSEYAWRIDGNKEEKGAQIDLLIDRGDDVINLCEMKFTKRPFKIDSAYDEILKNKLSRFIDSTKTRKAVRITMITSNPLVQNSYASDLPNQITAEELFRP